jgi:ELWxxDGT repeat protein
MRLCRSSARKGNTASFENIHCGRSNMRPTEELAAMTDVLLFSAEDSNSVDSLWVTNGTVSGTSELAVANSDTGLGLAPTSLTAFGSEVLFNGYDSGGKSGLWITNGTGPGTTEIPVSGANSTTGVDPENLAAFSGGVLFAGFDQQGHQGLWRTNVTSSGTVEISVTGAFSGNVFNPGLSPSDITAFDGGALFNGYDVNGAQNLWKTDGTSAGTVELTVSSAGASGLNPQDITVFNGGALFNGTDAGGAQDLWTTDGTGPNTSALTSTGFKSPRPHRARQRSSVRRRRRLKS